MYVHAGKINILVESFKFEDVAFIRPKCFAPTQLQ